MPLRPFNREQGWLLPPTLDQLIGADHPARFVAAFVDGLDGEAWASLEMDLKGDPMGAGAYHPRALLSIWLYGFMTGVRSSRKLVAAWPRPDPLSVAGGACSSPTTTPSGASTRPTGTRCGDCCGAPCRLPSRPVWWTSSSKRWMGPRSRGTHRGPASTTATDCGGSSPVWKRPSRTWKRRTPPGATRRRPACPKTSPGPRRSVGG